MQPLCLSISRGLQRIRNLLWAPRDPAPHPPNSQVFTQWGETSRPKASLLGAPSSPSLLPQAHPPSLKAKDMGGCKGWWRGEGAVMGGGETGQMFLEWDTG